MSKRDYYEVLNLTNNCTPSDVKRNFHKLALVWHPDKHSDKTEAEVKFKEIHEAYCVLKDESKRKIYDTNGHSGLLNSQEHKTCNTFTSEDFFNKNFFAKSSKSPFELFRNIFQDNDDEEDDDFYKDLCNNDPFRMPNLFNDNIRTFFEDAFESSENEDSESFFKRYKPSFMDTNFFSMPMPSLFKTFEAQNNFNSSEIFSSFFPSMNTETQSFSRTSTTFCNKGNIKSTIKHRFQKDDKVYETQQTYMYESSCPDKNQAKNCLNSKRAAKPIINKNKDFIIIEDSDEEGDNKDVAIDRNKKSKSDKSMVDKKRIPKNCKLSNNDCAFEINPSDEDFSLLFSNLDKLGAFKKNKK